MSELLSCPCCGEKARIDRYEHFYRVLCMDCPVLTEWLYSEQEAIDAWNTRVERTCHLIYCPDVLAGSKQYMCSSCRTYQSDGITYCPNCGSKVVE